MERFPSTSTRRMKLERDLALLALSVAFAAVLVVSGAAEGISDILGAQGFFGAFVAGIGFSFAFFAAPATVIIYELAQDHLSIWSVAILGALGAMTGDWILFRFLRNGLAEDFRYLLEQGSGHQRLRVLFRSRLFFWLGSFVAALVIASPLPDEIGLAMFGFLRYNTARFLPISFALNFLGVLIVVLAAQLSSG